MASTFKTFVSDDIANTRTLLHEAIPITGSIVNGVTYTSDENIKTYGHGMFQSVYDYPYTSSSANHIFDVTHGAHPDAEDVGGVTLATTNHPFLKKRQNIYNQMAQVLVGHKVNGEIRKFDRDGDLSGGPEHNSLIFINFARLLGKDEIKKGTFSLIYGPNRTDLTDQPVTVSDDGNESDYRVNSPAGEYSILKATGTGIDPTAISSGNNTCGLIFYQAGIVALSTKLFEIGDGSTENSGLLTNDPNFASLEDDIQDITKSMDIVANFFRYQLVDIQFSNTTELNSTIYFCRVGHNDFNYSSNPTYLENSRIRVKDKTTDAPVSYITTVGLYSSDNEMLAVAKLSEPLRKDPTNDITLRVRLDY